MRIKAKPTPKQYLAYEKLLDKTTIFLLFGGGAGGGKAQPLDSLVLTKKGFVEMRELKVGDKVITPDNKETEIVAIYPQGEQNVYEIEFIDGAKTKATEDHLWDCWISGRGQKRRKIRSTKQIKDIKRNVIIPLSEKLEFGKHFNKIDSYLVGVLLGDGGLTKNNIILTTADLEIVENLRKRIKDLKIIHKKKYQYSIVAKKQNKKGYWINPLLNELQKLGLKNIRGDRKFIPDKIKYGSLKNRLEVVRGLMDTDGTIDKRGHCSFSSKSKKLAEDLQFIIRSIGGKATLKAKKKFCYYNKQKRERIYWELYIQTKNNLDLFSLKRKKNRVKKFNGGASILGRRIKSIKFAGKEKTQCIVLKDKKGLYVTDDFIVTHNSWLGNEWIIGSGYNFPGSRWFIGRKELKRLMQSTFITFLKVCKHYGIPQSDWHLNGVYNYIEFKNGSRIDLLDLRQLPSDPSYERFGSLEYTGGWIEEGGEVPFAAFDVLKTRIGRWRNREFNLSPKMLITCNPTKNWIYPTIYRPYKEKTLPKEYAFIQSLYGDNPYTAQDYGRMLAQITDKNTKERLMFGNWEYEDDPNALIEYDAIIDLFTNTVPESEDKFLTADIARYGQSKTVIYLWKGMNLYRIIVKESQGIDRTIDDIRDLLRNERIPYSHAIVDEEGVGGGVVDALKIKGFVANSSPLENPITKERENYRNLKAQCGYMLAEAINKREISITAPISENYKQQIIEELEQLRGKEVERDAPLQLKPKEEIMEIIGRSPDFSDAMLQRMYFFLKREERRISPSVFRPGYRYRFR